MSHSQRQVDTLSKKCKFYAPLNTGDNCFVQNQTGRYPKRWDRQGQIVEVLDHNQYLVRLNGSRRLTLRNRKYLKKIPEMIQLRQQTHSYLPAAPTSSTMTRPNSAETPTTNHEYARTNNSHPTVMFDHQQHHVPAHVISPGMPHPPIHTPIDETPPTTTLNHHERVPNLGIPPLTASSPPVVTSGHDSYTPDAKPPQSTQDPTSPAGTEKQILCNSGKQGEYVSNRPSRVKSVPVWHKDYEMGAVIGS